MANIIWSEINEALVTDSQGDIKLSKNVEAVRSSIKNILGTYFGERLFLPQFGGSISNLLFEPINDSMLSKITSDIKDNIETWDDRVIITQLGINTKPDENYVELTIGFSVKGYSEVYSTTAIINA